MHYIKELEMSTAPISIRLPDKANTILEALAGELHTTKTKLIKDAIMERIEDYLDSKAIDSVRLKNEPTISHEELMRELGV